ncbi:MAG TPA: hypothetical protein VFR86_17560 [Burkholderiaceae bacterium]|nr:hypothetical protein [Burkholderiaceae bacterium]
MILACITLPVSATGGETAGRARDYAFSVYGGSQTDSNWHQSLTGQGDLVNAHLVVVALSRTLRRGADLSRTLEVEGNVARHYGDQHHWELNALTSARWHRFRWNDRLATTVAFGIGPSYATVRPPAEVTREGTSRRLLVYWQLELTLGPPRGGWATMVRLHHRSPAYGLFGGAGGGNALTAGLRLFF